VSTAKIENCHKRSDKKVVIFLLLLYGHLKCHKPGRPHQSLPSLPELGIASFFLVPIIDSFIVGFLFNPIIDNPIVFLSWSDNRLPGSRKKFRLAGKKLQCCMSLQFSGMVQY
jgi:hypothetical protein